MKRIRRALGILLLAAVPVGCAPSHYEEATLALLNVDVIALQNEVVLEDHMVVLSGNRIVAVEPTDVRRLPPDTRQVQGNGAYVLPGLTDMHVHAMSSTEDALERAFPLLVANGITTVRDMGSELAILTEVRARLRLEPGRAAPRVLAAGPLLDGVRKPWYRDLPLILETPAVVAEELPGLREAGVDFFKVYDDLDPATYDAIAAAANDSALPFAGHVPDGVSIEHAVEVGQRTIEHLGLATVKDCVDDPGGWFEKAIHARFRQGYDAYYRVLIDHWESLDWSRCEAVLTALGQPGVYFTPTLDMEINDRSRIDPSTIRYMAPGSQTWCNQVLEQIDAAEPTLRKRAYEHQFDAFRRIHEAGARILVGTDAPNNCVLEGFSLHGELALLVEAGLSPGEALRAATFHAARALGRGELAGLVEAGREADLVLLDENPLEEIGNTRSVVGVVLRGSWLDRAALDALLVDALSAVRQP